MRKIYRRNLVMDSEWQRKDTKVNVTKINEQFHQDIHKLGNFEDSLNYSR